MKYDEQIVTISRTPWGSYRGVVVNSDIDPISVPAAWIVSASLGIPTPPSLVVSSAAGYRTSAGYTLWRVFLALAIMARGEPVFTVSVRERNIDNYYIFRLMNCPHVNKNGCNLFILITGQAITSGEGPFSLLEDGR